MRVARVPVGERARPEFESGDGGLPRLEMNLGESLELLAGPEDFRTKRRNVDLNHM